MKLLVVEASADGLLDLAIRAKAAGHSVRYHLKEFDAQKCPVGRGLVDRVPDFQSSMRWADLVLLGGNGWRMAEFDQWKRAGVPIIGAGSEAVQWELDRMVGMAAFKRRGVPVPPYRQCASIDEAIAYVAKEDEGFAVKPCGDVADKSLSFVAKTGREMAWRLQRWKRAGKVFPQGLMVQERVQGVEMAVGAWIGPGGFAPGWEENFEEKRLMADNLGPNCGEAGTVMRLVRSSKLARRVLQPFEEDLVRAGFIGNVDVNCIIDDEGNPWPLEWTIRFGYPAINIETALHSGDPIEFLAGLAAGKPTATRQYDKIAVGVVLAIPPYPFGHEKREETVNVPIWGVAPSIEQSLHFVHVCQGDAPVIEGGKVGREPHLATAGSYVLVATGTGESVVEARGGAYRALRRLTIPASPFWRPDIGTRLRSQLDKLQTNGFTTGMRYT